MMRRMRSQYEAVCAHRITTVTAWLQPAVAHCSIAVEYVVMSVADRHQNLTESKVLYWSQRREEAKRSIVIRPRVSGRADCSSRLVHARSYLQRNISRL